MTNRNPVKRIFVTWPQTATTKQELLDFLQSNFDVQYALIAQESHEDGGKHLHACILTNKAYSAPHYIKKFQKYYPDDYKRVHVKPCRSFPHANEYCTKEDLEPIEFGTKPADQDPVEKRYRRIIRSLGNDIPFIRALYDSIKEEPSSPSFKYLYILEEFLK